MFDVIEQMIASYFGRKHCMLVGSGTAALYCCFRSLEATDALEDDAAILFPNITCETAVNAAIFAGFTPAFCDVSIDDFTISCDSMMASMQSVSIVGVVPTHMFGHLVDVSELDGGSQKHVPMIEDAAQAYGGTLADSRAGGMGLASIISFGDGKILDCGGGGAVLTDDTECYRSCQEVAAKLLPGGSSAAGHRAEVMQEMILARREFKSTNDREMLVRKQREILRKHKSGYLWQCTLEVAERIETQFPLLDKVVEKRRTQTKDIDAVLGVSSVIDIPKRRGNPALWRYTFLVSDGSRDQKLQRLRAHGVNVTKLFPPCDEKFTVGDSDLPVSREVSQTVINLHMSETADGHSHLLSTLKLVFA